MPEFLVFKAGKYPQGDWPVERVKRLVDSYDPENGIEAPAVIGHRPFAVRDADQFAHGWVKSLRMDGEGKVFATVDGFSRDAQDAIVEKKLRYISAEIFEFDKLNAAEPPYLRAIALLGRDTPAVTGTKITAAFTALFSGGITNTAGEEKNVTAFGRRLNAEEIKSLSASREESQTDQGDYMARTVEELEKELAESRAGAEAARRELAEARAGMETFRKELADHRASGRKAEAESFYGKLRDDGKLPPAAFAKTVELDARLSDAERGEFRSVFSAMGPTVDTSGKHVADRKNAAASAGTFGAGLTAKIRAFQTERKLDSYREAAAAMFAEKPELFTEEGSDD